MPRKIRQLEADLRKAGFVLVPGLGKGSHRGFQHPALPELKVILSGSSGDDAKDYQERDVKNALRQIRGLQ
jgi:predicted RNA binding protein YcfA (HicA-like mRNA interferase family)